MSKITTAKKGTLVDIGILLQFLHFFNQSI